MVSLWLRQWTKKNWGKGRPVQGAVRRPRTVIPSLEVLEERWLPSGSTPDAALPPAPAAVDVPASASVVVASPASDSAGASGSAGSGTAAAPSATPSGTTPSIDVQALRDTWGSQFSTFTLGFISACNVGTAYSGPLATEPAFAAGSALAQSFFSSGDPNGPSIAMAALQTSLSQWAASVTGADQYNGTTFSSPGSPASSPSGKGSPSAQSPPGAGQGGSSTPPTTSGEYPDGTTWTQTHNADGTTTTTTTNTNPDGSTTTTAYNPNGTTTTTTSSPNADGSTTTRTYNPGGSTTTTVTGENPDGSAWMQTTHSDGKGGGSSSTTTAGENPDGSVWSQTHKSDGTTITTAAGQNPDGSVWSQITGNGGRGGSSSSMTTAGLNPDGSFWGQSLSQSPGGNGKAGPAGQAGQADPILSYIPSVWFDHNPVGGQQASAANTLPSPGASSDPSASPADPQATLQQLAGWLGVPLTGLYGNDVTAVDRALQAVNINPDNLEQALAELKLRQAALGPDAPMPQGLDGNQQAAFNNIRATGNPNQTFIPSLPVLTPSSGTGAGEQGEAPPAGGWQPYQFPDLVPTGGDPTNAVSFDPNAALNRSFLDEAARMLNAPTAVVNGVLQAAGNASNFFSQPPAQQAQQISDAWNTWQTGARAILQDPLGSLLSALSGLSNHAPTIGGGIAAGGMAAGAFPGAFGAAGDAASAGTAASGNLADTLASPLQQAQTGQAGARGWLNTPGTQAASDAGSLPPAGTSAAAGTSPGAGSAVGGEIWPELWVRPSSLDNLDTPLGIPPSAIQPGALLFGKWQTFPPMTNVAPQMGAMTVNDMPTLDAKSLARIFGNSDGQVTMPSNIQRTLDINGYVGGTGADLGKAVLDMAAANNRPVLFDVTNADLGAVADSSIPSGSLPYTEQELRYIGQNPGLFQGVVQFFNAGQSASWTKVFPGRP